jgi:L,D-transpeptidase catalytic domain
MACSIRIGKAAFGFSICLVLLFISACSMQKTAATLENRTADEQTLVKDAAPAQHAQQKEPARIDYLTPLADIVSPEIYVYKEKRRLYVVQANVLVRDYPVGLGSNPSGDKERDGDGRTPVGDFLICQKNPANRYSKALGLNYPGKGHAEKALFSGILTQTEFKEILIALERKATPPWHTKLGGNMYIHAGGAQRDWTDGSIALYNSDMEELFQIASSGTPVHIRP